MIESPTFRLDKSTVVTIEEKIEGAEGYNPITVNTFTFRGSPDSRYPDISKLRGYDPSLVANIISAFIEIDNPHSSNTQDI